MFTHEETEQIERAVGKVLERAIDPIQTQLLALQKQVNLLTQGEISTAVGIDAMNDEEREKNKNNHH